MSFVARLTPPPSPLLQTLSTSSPTTDKPGAPKRAKWLITITDGEDNRSSLGAADLLMIEQQHEGVGVVIVAVGDLTTEGTLSMLCDPEQRYGPGVFIKASEHEAGGLDNAFTKVQAIISQDIMVESY